MTLTQVRPAGLDPRSGSIIQVQYTQYTSASIQSITANTDTAIDNITVNITPKFSNSIIKLDCAWFGEGTAANWTANAMMFFFRDSTKLSVAAASNRRVGITTANYGYHSADHGSTPDTANVTWFDAEHNTTSQITYKLGLNTFYGGTLYINRTAADSDTNEYERGACSISATEIAG